MGARRSFCSKALIPEHVDAEISQRYDFKPDMEIGAGGYGRVFLATDREAQNRTVAIKKVIIVDGSMRSDFQKEVLIMKDLDHPNICKVFASYDQGRTVYLVMEYCEGGELFERILEQEVIGEHVTAGIVKQVAGALKYAHGRGVAHRDLKPENVCFSSKDTGNNHVKVIDWGVGFYFGQNLQRMRSTVGSFAYSAPEVLEAQGSYTSACDLWSLGVLTYIMLCGQAPFSGGMALQLEQMRGPCPMEDPAWRGISGDAKDIIRGLLRHDPAKRITINAALVHPWLRIEHSQMDPAAAQRIFRNLRQFSSTCSFFSLCAASVARQLDHRGLEDVQQAFRDMDSNGDGVLELHEVRAGFERVFGSGSAELHDIDDVFTQLDLDGSGAVDYTEFCAAGLGERLSTEVDAVKAAFKAFDVVNDGRITKAELEQVLTSAGVGRASPETYTSMAEEMVDRFDRNGDGCLDFDEWLRLMRDTGRAPGEGPGSTALGETTEWSLASTARPLGAPLDPAPLGLQTPWRFAWVGHCK